MFHKILGTIVVMGLCIVSLAASIGANNPKNWTANSNGKMTISYDQAEDAVKFEVKFRKNKKNDYWIYPRLKIIDVPANAKALSFEARTRQLEANAGYRCSYVFFTPKGKGAWKTGSEWHKTTVEFSSAKVKAAGELGALQIGLNPKSLGVTYWLKNLNFITTDGKTVPVKVKVRDIAELKKLIPENQKWKSPDIRPIAKPAGFFRVKKYRNKWWFVDPEGKPFYSIGVNYCRGVGKDWPPRTESDFQKAWLQQEPLSRKMGRKYKQWNFNTCGSVGGNWNGRFPATPVFRCLQYANSLASKGEVPRSKKYKFVDVYSPEFAKVCDRWAKIAIKPEADNPLIIGWFIDNEFHLPQDEAFQDKFYQVVIAAIRKYDKNHILLGTRFETTNRSDMDIKMVGKYCDVISVNYYDYPHKREAMKRLYELSGKPVLIGEFTSAARENGFSNGKYWIGGLFKNQTDRAKGYERYVSDIAELPYMVGAHFFMFTDRNEPKLNNWGLRDQDGKLYYDFVRHLAKINQRLPLIHAGKLKPRKFPELKTVPNDNPHTSNVAKIAKDGSYLWQAANLHYCCTPNNAPYYFDRISDENWGYRKEGFIEYRFTLKKPIDNAYIIIRYASFPGSTTHKIKVEVNDDEVAVATCPKATENLTIPPGWAYGFSLMKLTTVTVPLKVNIPAGVTNVRFIVEKPWKPKHGVIMQGFFLCAGPHKVNPDNYYGLIPVK